MSASIPVFVGSPSDRWDPGGRLPSGVRRLPQLFGFRAQSGPV